MLTNNLGNNVIDILIKLGYNFHMRNEEKVIKTQSVNGMTGLERLRDSLVHGRYIFDGGDRVYVYDGRDNYHLEYMFSLNIHELIATKDELTQHYLAAIQEKQNNDEDFEEKEQR